MEWSLRARVCYEDLTYCYAPELLAPIRHIPLTASTELSLARYISVKTSRTLLHPAHFSWRDVASTLSSHQILASPKSAVSSQNYAVAPAKGIVTPRVTPISRINFLPWARSPGRWKTPTQRPFILAMSVHPFLFIETITRFLLMSFVRFHSALPAHPNSGAEET